MPWERIRHWHWLVIAILLGVTVAKVREQYVDDAIKDLGESLNGQGQFEESLLQTIQGRRLFDNVIVTPERIDDGLGGKRSVHVVRGMYWNGRIDRTTQSRQPVWRPAFFVAVVPYHPQLNLAGMGAQGDQIAAHLASVRNPTVLDFLSAVHQTHGVAYSYPWWRGSAYALWLWLTASVLLIGIALPVVINLTVYGTLWRPRAVKEKAVDSSKVETSTHAAPASSITDQDLAHLIELERELEEKLGQQSPATAAAQAEAIAEVRKLTGTPLASADEIAAEHKEFGAKDDDFYPTERRAHH
jgi:hypothetical protein